MVTVKEQDESWSSLSSSIRDKIREIYKEHPDYSLELIFGKQNLEESLYNFKYKLCDRVSLPNGEWIEIKKPYMADGLKRYQIVYLRDGKKGDLLESEIGSPPKFKPGDKVITDNGKVLIIKNIRRGKENTYEVEDVNEIFKEHMLKYYSKFLIGDMIIFTSSREIGTKGRVLRIEEDDVTIMITSGALKTFDKKFLEDNATKLEFKRIILKEYLKPGDRVYLKDIDSEGVLLRFDSGMPLFKVPRIASNRRYDLYGNSLIWPYEPSVFPPETFTIGVSSLREAWELHRKMSDYHSVYLDIFINLQTEGKTEYIGKKRIEFNSREEAKKYFNELQ